MSYESGNRKLVLLVLAAVARCLALLVCAPVWSQAFGTVNRISAWRHVMKPTPSSHDHMNRFAIAIAAILGCVSLFAVVLPTEASIVYTPTNVTISARILHRHAMYGLDLNNDGVIDVSIIVGYDPMVPCRGGGSRPFAFAEEIPAAGNGAEGAPPAALEKGEPIGPSQTYYTQNGVLRAFSACTVTWFGAFGGQERYLGLRFQINGKTHYGWARLTAFAYGYGASATLTGYAYETTPGAAINAGQTTGAEDSSALRPGVAYPQDSGASAGLSTRAASSGFACSWLSGDPLLLRKESEGE